MDYATLEDVVTVAANDVWAVGYSEDFATLRLNTLVLHWDGTTWTIVPSPNPAGINLPNQLFGIAAAAANDIWAVGEMGVSNDALILHWDGTSWNDVPNDCRYGLHGVTVVSPSDVWAVGGSTTCHYDGTTWVTVPSPQPRGEYDELDYPLQDVSAVTPNDIWAVGARIIDDVYSLVWQSFAEHWNGSEWTAFYNLPGTVLYGVEAIASNDVWAVGTYSIGTLIVHWDGTRWSKVASPDPRVGGELWDIDATSATSLWAAGAFYNNNYEQRTLVEATALTASADRSPVESAPSGIASTQRSTEPAPDGVRVAPNGDGTIGVHLALSHDGDVDVRIADVAGRVVRRLAPVNMSAGSHTLVWDGRDERGERVRNGVYLVRIAFAGVVSQSKVLLIR
jgi:hypothetical protein